MVALKNGTMGWHLAGFELDHGADRVAGEVSAPALDWSKNAAARVAERFGVRKSTVRRLKMERRGRR